ncbi:hypothetical protein [Paraburkholderia terrae]|uniref:hypothetical protein n=1 Tax=Paraburkholderia terrae TaxID=311230 RepID=UPI0012E03E07|nr:hypothetical protein [Paraburkholderia terrae]
MNENRRILLGSLVGLATMGAGVRAGSAQAALKDHWQFTLWSPYSSTNTAYITGWNPDDPPGVGRFRAEIRGNEILHDKAPWPSGESFIDRNHLAAAAIKTSYAGTGNSDYLYTFQILANDQKDIPGWNKRGDVRYVVLGHKSDNKWRYPGNMSGSP